jgi:predicted metalloprotease with PDZ domain
MKNFFLFSLAIVLGTTTSVAQKKTESIVKATIDLVNIKDDKVLVTMMPATSGKNEVVFQIPKTVPGTYSSDNYGKYVDDLKAFTTKGKELTVTKTDENTWKIADAKGLSKITYYVNDTFDTETGRGFGKDEVFSPAGTNILEGKNFMINGHAFVGYFDGNTEVKYTITIDHPTSLVGATSLEDNDKSDSRDVFNVARYFEFTDNPIMYSKPDLESFEVDGMKINFSVYSPNGTHTAKALLPDLEASMRAQKKFLGPINNNTIYTVLLYLSDMRANDAKGFGALEHHTSTTVVFPEGMPTDILGKQIIDVVSHEFFHIVTPLSIHSKEIQFFDYNNPKMSKHLWMYEGVTEYFANLFQVNQGLIDESEFFNRMNAKITNASRLNDRMPFTEMSEKVLEQPYKDQYLNVYEKGALIGMCIDIIIREKSNGQKGILDLMQKLSKEYGPNVPFEDADLFPKITSLTYPEVGDFLNTYVAGSTPINYNEYFTKMGVGAVKKEINSNPFLKDQTPFVTINPETKEILVIPDAPLNDFMNTLGLKGGDVLVAFNDKAYNLDNIYDMIMDSQDWKSDETIKVKLKRDGKEQTITGKIKLSKEEVETFDVVDPSKMNLKEAWLKG